MPKTEILVAYSAGRPHALGNNIWRITAKKTDFYLEPNGETGGIHLSVHGPNAQHPGYIFRLRLDRQKVAQLAASGFLFHHTVPRQGYAVSGEQLAPGIFLVARIRWLWHLQRPRFLSVAELQAPKPDVEVPGRSGGYVPLPLRPNEALDLDLVVSFGDDPHWPSSRNSLRDNARVGPLRNEAGMWLTGTLFRRSLTVSPNPEGLDLPAPRPGQHALRFTGAGPARNDVGEIYWFVETIAPKELFLAS
jgi:hypothetical protein